MTTYVFDSLANGTTINGFDPNVDVLQFNAADAPSVMGAELSPTSMSFTFGGNTVTVNGLALRQMAAADPVHDNVLFSDGGVWFVGDGQVSALADDGPNIVAGTIHNDQLIGLAGDDEIRPGAGNDWLHAGAGIDTVSYADATAAVSVTLNLPAYAPNTPGQTSHGQSTGGAGTDALYSVENVIGSSFNDTLIGRAADTWPEGNLDKAGNNVIEGGAGNDYMDGVSGSDTVSYASATAGVSVSLALATAQNTGGAGTDTLLNFDDVIGSNFDDTLTGNSLANVFIGGLGNDTIDGGADFNTASYATATAAVSANLALTTGQVTGGAGTDTLINVENLIGSSFNDTFIGNAQDNALEGGDGDDFLDGAAGTADSLSYLYATAGVSVSLALTTPQNTGGAGTDTVLNFEILGGSQFNDTLTGDAGDNLILGLAGDDTIDGGAGVDTAYYAVSPGPVVANLATGIVTGGLGNDTLVNIENLIGSDYFDTTLTGNAWVNRLMGRHGNDTIDGGAGADTLIGWDGNDTYVVDNVGDVVTEDPNEGTDLVQSSITCTLAANIENLTLTGAGAINGTGNTLANIITGNAAANVLDGAAGADTLIGGAGNDTLSGGAGNDSMAGGTGSDTYSVDLAIDTVTENPGEGSDTVLSTASYTLGANVENLTLLDMQNVNGSGNAFANTITGNAGDNVLDGGAGDDTLTGGAGNDTLAGGAGSDSMAGGAGNDTYSVDLAGDLVTENADEGSDTVQASISYALGPNVENLTLTGNANIDGAGNSLANVIIGNDSNNTLNGVSGNDTLAGGSGDDTYVVNGTGASAYTVVIQGLLGRDTLDASGASGAVQINLNASATSTIDNATVSFSDGGTVGSGLDLVLLEDLSGSFYDDVAKVRGLVPQLVSAVRAVQPDVRFGVTAFVDKPESPFGSSGDYVYKTVLPLTTDASGAGNALQAAINGLVVLGGNDGPEAQLEALMQAALRTSEVGYQSGAMHAVVLMTDAPYHRAGDGALGNPKILTTNNADAVLDGTPAGTGEDYPSLAQVKTALAGAQVVPIFAVTSDQISTYRDLVAQLGVGAVVTLGTDSSNLVSAITAGMTSVTQMVLENAIGASENDTLIGNAADNVLDGRAGADTMAGGIGNDTYVVDNVADVITENPAEGTDLVQSSVTFALAANVDKLALTGASAINGTGNALNNVITGNAVDNVLDGAAGADTLVGGIGNDTYVVDNVADVVTENSAEGTELVQSNVTYTLAANVENLTLTGASAINGTGNALNNVITGNSANNVLDGAAGADTLLGGIGNDTFVVDNVADVITENPADGSDLVQSSVTYTLAANVENLSLTGVAAINGTGNALDNTITGNSGNNVLNGDAGNDTLNGGAGSDSMAGGAGDDTYAVDLAGDSVTENAGEGSDTVVSTTNYTLGANLENLTLQGTQFVNGTGNEFDNVILGNAGNNVIVGGEGNDTLNGGAGVDTVSYVGAATEVTVNLTQQLAQGAGADTLVGFENVTGSDYNDTLTGSSVSNVLMGALGDDTLDGRLGDDTLNGGLGVDTASYSASAAGVRVSLLLAGAQNTLGAGLDTLVGIENLTGTESVDVLSGNAEANVLGGLAGDDMVDGGAGNDVLNGNAGNDTLNGGAGSDSMAGGAGDDTYSVDLATDTVTENAGEGTDRVLSTISYTLGANVENLTLRGASAINGTGNALDNTITGNAGNNVIIGGEGNDTLNGGAGMDTASYAGAAGGVTVDLGRPVALDTVGAGLDTLIGFENATGSDFNDRLIGSGVANVLVGGLGDDTLNGRAGDDTLNGGMGVDTADYVASTAGVSVSLALAGAQDTLGAGLDRLIGIENLRGSQSADALSGNAGANLLGGLAGNDVLDGGAGNDVLNGEVGDDTLLGGAGNDTLTGGAGSDSMAGGTGSDSYSVNLATDTVTENPGEGIDTVLSTKGYTLGANLENLTLLGTQYVNATGNALDNRIVGNDGNNVIIGGEGNDALDGGAGVDTTSYAGAAAGVTVNLTQQVAHGAGADTLVGFENVTGSDFNDTLSGNAVANVLVGGLGDDTLDGRLGDDTLNGGLGVDTASYAQSAAGVSVNLARAGAQDTVGAGLDRLVGIENLSGSQLADTLTGNAGANVLGGLAGNDVLDGGGGNDTLTGGAGNDMLTGGAGSDSMAGGTGSDSYSVNFATDTVTENPGEGSDTVLSTIGYTLGADLENLTLLGTQYVNGTGNALANTIIGNVGNNVLDGGAGMDTLSYASATAGVSVSLAQTTAQITGGAGTDTVLNFENLTGSNFDDTLSGNAASNMLDGGAGADTLAGAAGGDVYIVDNAGDVVTENLAEGMDRVRSSVTYTLVANVENLTLTGVAANDGTGNELNNVITGNAGDNVLDGGAGTDIVTYVSATAGVNVSLAQSAAQVTGGAGTDTVLNFESVIGSKFDDTLSGDAGANMLTGGAGADTLTGGAGADRFVFDNMLGADSVTDFESGTDRFRISQAGIRIGDGDTVIDAAATVAGPGGFAAASELVIVTGDIAGAIDASSAATAIDSADSAYAAADTRLFVVDNGTASGLFLFTSSGADAAVSAAELTLVGVATSTPATVLGDYMFAT